MVIAWEQSGKPYTFRKLSAVDIFPMAKIISKIGMNEITGCFEKDSVKELIHRLFAEQPADEEEGGSAAADPAEDFDLIVGASVVLEIADIVFRNLPKIENDVFDLLSQVSNLPADTIRAFDLPVFAEMVIDFIKKEEFRDFFKVVSKLFN